MSTTTTGKPQIIESAIKEISHIATLPEITMKVIELVEDSSSTAQDLHKLISVDPALCSRILKVVNSSFYGLPGQIGSINRAIVLLGLNAVKNIAVSASLAKLFRGGQLCPQFSAKDLWNHSVTAAAAAKLITIELKLGVGDEAFLSGLMHDIGIMVEMQYQRDKLIEAFNQVGADKEGVPSKNLLEIETEVFGANHQDFGQGLSKKWKFPAAFANVTGHHHNPLEIADGARVLPCIVYVADRLSARSVDGFRLDLPDTDIDPSVLDAIKLTKDQCESISGKLSEGVADIEAMLA
ncbi:MAG: HDOD domain-containing protein [Phycisphaeraceae bacterium]|nr:HDOD domain-containing protein [Phycisphaerales bacterium]MCB9842706.1 HDOD domain-containing protein [Phycisphaeraceae bacterium]